MPRQEKSGTGICIVAHSAFGALSGGATGQLGGVERQTSMLARWLAARGHKISLVTWDEGQPEDCVIDGVRVIKMCKVTSGVPGVRFFTPRWASLNRALREADASLYYHNCGEHITGQVALWAKSHHRKFVFSSAHDFDCEYNCPGVNSLRERILLRYGLRNADRLIVQTIKQQQLIRDSYALESVVLPMPCPGPDDREYVEPEFPVRSPRVLWVGRIAPVKRLEWLLDLAEMLPEISFDVAGMPDRASSYTRDLLARAETLPNVTMHGRVPRDAMPELYRRATLLCSTSTAEGFPNTFLEAWSLGKPLVTTFDPDGVVERSKLGITASDVASLAAGVGRLIEDAERWRACSRNCREYFVQHHSLDSVMSRFEQVFLETLGVDAPPVSISEDDRHLIRGKSPTHPHLESGSGDPSAVTTAGK